MAKKKKKSKTYRLRNGYPFQNLDIEAVGQELEAIEAADGLRLRPDAVVEAAALDHSAMHGAFDWDDTSAAHKFRLHVAKKLIASVEIIVEDRPASRAFYHVERVEVGDKEEPPGYVNVGRVFSQDEYLQQVLARAKQDLASFREKYNSLRELDGVIHEIGKLLDD